MLTFAPVRKIWQLVTIGVALLLLATFIDRFVIVEMLAARLALPLAVALLTALAATGAGLLATRLRPDPLLCFAIGYPIFGTICFLAGLVKIAPATMLPLAVLFAAVGGWALWRSREARVAVTAAPERPAFAGFSLVAVAVVLACGFVAAQAPPSSLDELAYHLAVPHAWVNEGHAVDLPLISHSYFPLGIESADLPALTLLGALYGGIASHLLHLIAAIGTALLIYRRSRSALVTAAIVATPALALTSGWSLVDWPLLAICVAFLDDDENTRGAALAAGLLTKYTFLPFAIVAVLVTRRWRGLAPGAAAGAVFFLRNLILTGNPIAPFLGAGAPHVSGYRTLTLASYVFDGRFIDESLGAALFALLPAIGGALAIALFAAGVVLWLGAPSARLLVPFFGAAATSARPERSRLLSWLIAVAVVAQLVMVVYFTDRNGAFATISGKESDQQFLERNRASFATVTWLDGLLPPASRTLVVGLNETYWFGHRVRGGGNFDGPRVSSYLDVPSADALRERLRQDGITHVAVISAPPPTAVAQKAEERETRLTPSAQRALAAMLDSHASNVTSRGNAVLFTLR